MTHQTLAPKPGFDITETGFWRGLLATTRVITIACAVGSTLTILATAFMRYVMNMNFFGSEDIILLFAFWLYFLGAAYGSYEESHIKADLLNVYIHNLRIKDGLALLAQVITLIVTTILMTWGFNQVVWLMEKMPRTTALKIPILATQGVMFISFVLMLFFEVVYLVKNTRKYFVQGHFSEAGARDYLPESFRGKCACGGHADPAAEASDPTAADSEAAAAPEGSER